MGGGYATGMEQNPSTLLLCRDLMFVSKVTATARAKGVAVQVVRDVQKVPQQGSRLIVDLNEPGALEAAAAWKGTTGGRVIGFASHVDTATMARAKEAGLDEVMTRGRFTGELEGLLGG